jgi:hypothetical protein
MTKHSGLCAALLVTISAVAFADKTTTIADLRALVDQKAYEEAIGKLGDIAPTERNAEWQDLASKAATGFVNAEQDGPTKLGYILRIDSMYPTLVENASYSSVRTDVASKNYAACFDHQSRYTRQSHLKNCVDVGATLVDGDPANAALALTLSKTAYHQLKDADAYLSVVLFKRAVDAAKGGATCKDADTWAVTQRGMGGNSDSDTAKAAHDISVACWSDLRKPFLAWLGGTQGNWRKNACVVMREKNESDLSLCANK